MLLRDVGDTCIPYETAQDKKPYSVQCVVWYLNPLSHILLCRYRRNTQLVLIAPGDDLISLMTDSADANHGLCNAVFVALVPTTAQYAALQQYSKSFKVGDGRHRGSGWGEGLMRLGMIMFSHRRNNVLPVPVVLPRSDSLVLLVRSIYRCII